MEKHNKELEDAMKYDPGQYEDPKDDGERPLAENLTEDGEHPLAKTKALAWKRKNPLHTCFVTTKGSGPSWHKVTRRETYHLDTGELNATEKFADSN